MRKLGFAAAVCALLVGCSGPKSTVIPTDPSKWDQLSEPSKKLSDDDRKEFAAYMARMGLASVFSGGKAGIAPGTTIGDAIKNQKDFEAQQAEADAQAAAVKAKVDAERAAQIAKINQAVTVAVTDMDIARQDVEAGRFSDRLDLTIGIENHGSKPITGVKGVIDFKDQFGTEISTLNTSLTEDVAPGATRSIAGYGRDLNQFEQSDQTLSTTPYNRLHITFVPQVVVFADGSKIEAPEESGS